MFHIDGGQILAYQMNSKYGESNRKMFKVLIFKIYSDYSKETTDGICRIIYTLSINHENTLLPKKLRKNQNEQNVFRNRKIMLCMIIELATSPKKLFFI